MNRLHDERGIIAGSLLRTVLIIALVGLAAVETSAVLFARLQAQDLAETAATTGAATYRDSHDVERARAATLTAIADKDRAAALTAFEVFSDERVRVVVTKRANTLFIQRIGFLKGFSVAIGRHTAEPPPA
jgi:hypothetical protein